MLSTTLPHDDEAEGEEEPLKDVNSLDSLDVSSILERKIHSKKNKVMPTTRICSELA